MKTLASAAVLAAIAAGLSGCGDYDKNEASYDNNAAAYSEGESNYSAGDGNYSGGGGNYTSTTASTKTTWPEGARIVVDNGVTYRIEPGGARVRLGPDDSRIVVENGIRYRVDPGGNRMRIDDQGLQIRVDADGDIAVNSQ